MLKEARNLFGDSVCLENIHTTKQETQEAYLQLLQTDIDTDTIPHNTTFTARNQQIQEPANNLSNHDE